MLGAPILEEPEIYFITKEPIRPPCQRLQCGIEKSRADVGSKAALAPE